MSISPALDPASLKSSYYLDISGYELKDVVRQSLTSGILANATGQPLEVIERDTDRDFYLDAKGAVEYGLVDQVLEAPEKQKAKA